jgi:hypothetical protein
MVNSGSEISFKEILRDEEWVYYRVFVDGVNFASPVYIHTTEEAQAANALKIWCQSNTDRLKSGKLVYADLSSFAD